MRRVLFSFPEIIGEYSLRLCVTGTYAGSTEKLLNYIFEYARHRHLRGRADRARSQANYCCDALGRRTASSNHRGNLHSAHGIPGKRVEAVVAAVPA